MARCRTHALLLLLSAASAAHPGLAVADASNEDKSAVAVITRLPAGSPSGSFRLCSGVLVAPQLVLTAAHCVPRSASELQSTLATSLESVEFLGSARDLDSAFELLAGATESDGSRDASPILSAWSDEKPDALEGNGSSDWSRVTRDVGILELSEPIFGAEVANLLCLRLSDFGAGGSRSGFQVGYSSMERKIARLDFFRSQHRGFFFSATTLGTGDSGSGLYLSHARSRAVVGVTSGINPGGGTNFAPITQDLLTRIAQGSGQRLSCSNLK